jgi:hypothetical protein
MLALLCLLLQAAPEAAKLDLVLGGAAVEADGKPLAVGATVAPGASVRTPKGVLAVFRFADGTELRVNEETEFRLEEARRLELRKGRIHASVAKGPPFVVRTETAAYATEAAVFDLVHYLAIPKGPQCFSTLCAFEGTTEVRSRRYGQKVTGGYQCLVIGAQMNTPDPLEEGALETDWMHPILRERGAATPEVEARARELVRLLAAQEKDDPYEPSLRSLGDLAVPALAEALSAPGAPRRRAAALRLAGELATAKSAPTLLALLGHAEADVRVQAARALARAAGKDLGFRESYWRGDALDEGRKAWAKELGGKP